MRGEVFGRDAELGVLDGFLAGLSSGPAGLVLAGTAGAGKTTLLQAGSDKAAGLGYVTLRTSPSHSDMRLAFAGLADLLGPRPDAVLAGLPAPQRHALSAALLIEEAPSVPPEPRVIAAAFRTSLLLLAASAPVLLVIDDVQWLDAPTAAAVGFALRRLSGEPIGLLCARRVEAGPPPGPPLELGRARLGTEVLSLGGLSVGALHHLLRTRLDTSFSHPTLRRIEAESAGNPFVALEIGRALARRGITRLAGGPLPVPATLAGLVGERLHELPAPVLRALEAVAIMPGEPLDRYLAAGVAGDDLDAAVTAGVLDADAGPLRFSHPLLASAVRAAIPPARRRRLHAFAAASAADPEQQARHRALAADGPSVSIAATLDDAARVAELRGAPATAAELLELAASVTPDDARDAIHRRLLAAGRLLALAGETHAAADVLNGLAARTPPGPRHAEVVAHLGWNSEEDFEASTRLLEQALAEAEGAPELSANIHLFLADHWAIRGDITGARAQMRHALGHAEQAADPGLLATVLAQAFLFDWIGGVEADEHQLERALELERGLGSLGLLGPPSMAAGLYLMGVGRLDEARDALDRALARAEAEGAEYTRSDVLLRLSLIASRTGHPRRGAELGQAAPEIAEQLDLGQLTSAVLFGCGFAALQLGQQDRVRALAQRGLELSGRGRRPGLPALPPGPARLAGPGPRRLYRRGRAAAAAGQGRPPCKYPEYRAGHDRGADRRGRPSRGRRAAGRPRALLPGSGHGRGRRPLPRHARGGARGSRRRGGRTHHGPAAGRPDHPRPGRARPDHAGARRGAAAAQAAPAGPRDARRGDLSVRERARRAMGGPGPPGTGPGQRPHRPHRRAHHDRTAGGRADRPGHEQPGRGRGAVRHGQDHRVHPDQDLRQARRALAHPARQPAAWPGATRHKVWISAFTPRRSGLRLPYMRYLAEFYLPGRGVDLAGLARRARASAEQSSRTGPAVRFVSAIHAPEDESCFAIYDADSPAGVSAAGALAGIAFDRIVEVAMQDASEAAGEAG